MIKGLCERFPEFSLFFNTHFKLYKKTSLRPREFDNGKPIFPTEVKIGRKTLKEEDKRDYYNKDFALWVELYGTDQDVSDRER